MTTPDLYTDPYEGPADPYEGYAEKFNQTKTDRRARRNRKPRVQSKPKIAKSTIARGLADEVAGLEGGFETTYQPSRHEEGWLLDSLRSFYQEDYISDVVAVVKGGKEASVYRCEATENSGEQWLAAKVYRPRMFRNLRNDAMYRQGRAVLSHSGQAVKQNEHRIMRALGKKTTFGQQVAHTSWLMHEFSILEALHLAGASVPKPFAANNNAILMEYIGGEHVPAPTLNQFRLDRSEARACFAETLRNIELMLSNGVIHGDLSAYNILYWEGSIVVIDFPQVTNCYTATGQINRNARFILGRDIQRVCDYFARCGVKQDANAILDRLWRRYVELDPDLQAADDSRFELPEPDEV